MSEFVIHAVPALRYTGANADEVAQWVASRPAGQVEVSIVSADDTSLTLRLVMYGGPENGGPDFEMVLQNGDWLVHGGGDTPDIVTAADFAQRWLRLEDVATK